MRLDSAAMCRRAVATALAVIVLIAAGAAAALAHAVTGSQNPQLRVTVSITPVNAHAGQTIVARGRSRSLPASRAP
jgi:hypothetical protein